MKNQKTNKSNFLLTITGPTAVGKTDLTLILAKKYNSHIFSADSRQIYKELNIGTAKPDLEVLDSVKHHFINHISIHDAYNVGRYEKEIDGLFNEYFISHNIGILSGGTGMYIKAALEGLDYFPDVDASVVNFYEEQLKDQGIASLQKELIEKDPVYTAKVDLENTRRLVRALSIIKTSGKPFSSFLNQKSKKQLPFIPINICLTRNREQLYSRINKRVDSMMKQGLLDEVKELVDWQKLKSLSTVGYAELFQYINREITLEKAIELIKRNSRRYAKRQMTWYRNQGTWEYFDADDNEAILDFIDIKINQFS